MKYLNYVLLLIISVLLLTGCGIFGDDGSDVEKEPEFEPYTVGAWYVASPVNAQYEGTKSKANPTTLQSDTVVIDQPGQQSLELIKEKFYAGNTVQFTMSFIDSTINTNDNINIKETEFIGTRDVEAFRQSGTSMSLNQDRFKAGILIDYRCGGIVPSNFNIKLELIKEDGLYRHYIIQSKGFMDILNDEFCN